MSSVQEDVFEIGVAEKDREPYLQEATVPRRKLPLVPRVCSLLFVSSKPLTLQVLSDASGGNIEDVEAALGEIKGMFDEETHGFSLVAISGAWQLRTSPLVAKTIQKLIPARARRLSRAAAETLAVIAYKQPVQKAEVEAVRGVDAMPTLKTLLEARLIRIVGRGESAGRPALYGTTQNFLEKFGLNDLSELPTVRELEELAAEPGEAVEDSVEELREDLENAEDDDAVAFEELSATAAGE